MASGVSVRPVELASVFICCRLSAQGRSCRFCVMEATLLQSLHHGGVLPAHSPPCCAGFSKSSTRQVQRVWFSLFEYWKGGGVCVCARMYGGAPNLTLFPYGHLSRRWLEPTLGLRIELGQCGMEWVESQERRQSSGNNSLLLNTFLDFGYNWRCLEISKMRT